MISFRYEARSGQGQIKTGVIEAEAESLVAARLRHEGLFPLSIEKAAQRAEGKDRRVSGRDISSFTRQLSDLLCSGFTLSSALGTLALQARTPELARLIEELRRDIEKGSEFSAALARHPALFSGFYAAMVRIGEAGGKLEDSLKRLADFREREDEFLAQIRSALVYPVFLLGAGIVSILVLSAFFIPRLAKLFADFGQALPLSTRVVIFAGDLLGKSWWALLFLAVSGALSFRAFIEKERNRAALDTALLRVPVLNRLILKIESARFAYALGVLLQSGIPILEGLNIAGLNVTNRRMRLVIASFYEKIRKGRSLSSCLKEEGQCFPGILYRMTAVGEESGALADMLLKASGAFENEVNRSLKSTLSLIEPCMVLAIGGLMVVIVFSILLPVFQLDFFAK